MKVLWFTINPSGATELLKPSEPHGGWMSSLEKELKKTPNIEIHVCFYWSTVLEAFEYKNVFYHPVCRKNTKTKLHRLLNRLFFFQNDKFEILQLLDVVKDVNPDLIHIHGAEENFGLLQKYCAINTVVSIQSILSPYLIKYYSGISKFSAFWNEEIKSKLLVNSAHYNYRLTRRNALREIEIYRFTKNVIGRTNWDKRISRLLAPNSNYFVGNEMLRGSFYNNRWNKNNFDSCFKIVTTMSGGLYKGLETIVETSRLLKQNNFNSFKWTIVGQSESSSISKLVKKWLKINFDELNIKLVGLKTENELVEILVDSDVYCQVSHIENSPNSVCEAMLLGMPIIASFAGGTDSILENNLEGILLQDGDFFSYAGAIVEMFNNFNNAKALGDNALIRAKKRHDTQNIINDLLSTYNKISNN
jgi:glycosyltransferase involved in cell wall biosynthesis